MFNPENINLQTLPSLPLEDRRLLPETPGIYFAINSLDQIQYIGRSVNLRQRWLNHHRHSQLEGTGSVRLVWLEVSEPELLPGVEEALIEYYQPSLNGQWFAEDSIFRLKAAAYEKGVKLSEIADAIDVHPNTISKFASGKQRSINLDMLYDIADYLGVEPGELFKKSERKYTKKERQAMES